MKEKIPGLGLEHRGRQQVDSLRESMTGTAA